MGQLKNYKVVQKNHKVGQKNHKMGQVLQSAAKLQVGHNITFQKRTDVLINGFQYYDTTTQKQETIEFYEYHYHLKNFGFMCNMPP